MMRKDVGRIAVIALAGAALTGCRFKGVESFLSATTPNLPASQDWKGDAYTSAGYAESSGGVISKTRYGTGANPDGSVAVGDQAAKGSGLQPGENPAAAAPGFGNSNAPANQPSAKDASSITVRTGI